MSHQGTLQGNLTSVWSIIKGHIDAMVDKAMQGSHIQAADSNMGLGRFKLRFENHLGFPLNHVIPGQQMGQTLHSIHQEIKGAVEEAIDATVNELNITSTNASDKESFVDTLDNEIEYDVYNEVYRNTSVTAEHVSSFFDSLSLKDEAVFVALVSIGVIIPIIIFTLLSIFCYRKYRETKRRRHEMLLRDQPDLCMDDYSSDVKPHLDDAVPDLNLRYLKT